MLVTLTPDPVIDRAYFIPAWTPGLPMRAERTTISIGGKGLDASVALSHLDVTTQAFCFISGATGEQLFKLLKGYGFQTCPIWGAGETRTALIIVEEAQQRHSHIFSGGLQIDPNQAEALIGALETALADSGWLICGGSLPPTLNPDFYARIIRMAHQYGTAVLIDSFGPYLRPALAARPEIVKMNRHEFESTFGLDTPDLDTLIQQAGYIRQRYNLPALVITCGQEGILGLNAEGVWMARPPAQTVVNAAGAGDAASGVLVWQLGCGESWPEALRQAAAAGTAVVLTETTADLRQSDFERILPQVRIDPLK